MNKKIIAMLDIVVLILIIVIVNNTEVIRQIDPRYLIEQQVDIEVLKNIIIDAKLVMYTIPILLLTLGFALLLFKKSFVTYLSLIVTVISLLLVVVNIATFDNKLLSENMSGDSVLSAETELILLQVNDGAYENKSQYIENLIDIIIE